MVLARALKLLRKQQRLSLRESESDSLSEIESPVFESPVFESPEDNQCQNVVVQVTCHYDDNETERTTSSFSFSDMSDEDDGDMRVRALKMLLHERGIKDDEPASQPVTQTKLQADTESLPSLSESEDDMESSRAVALRIILQDRVEKATMVMKERKCMQKRRSKARKREKKTMRLKELSAMEKKKAKPSSKFSLQPAKSQLTGAGPFFRASVPNSFP